MFQSQVQFPVNLTVVADVPDNEVYHMWVAPAACEVISLYGSIGASIAHGEGTGLILTLLNGGTAGTSTTAIGSIGAGTTESWTADTIKTGTLGAATLAAGEVLCVKYDETAAQNVVWMHVSANIRYGTS
jgi:hypothetical protein